jgi:predicted ATPase
LKPSEIITGLKQKTGKIIISGGPGFGKTSIIDALSILGFACEHEISRSIIKDQIDTGGDILPWKNLELFSRIVFEKRLHQFHEAPQEGLVFFDRGVPDVLAYMMLDHIEIPDRYYKSLLEVNYNNLVFLTPPWEKIFANDAERMENFEQAVNIHHKIEAMYRELGYETCPLPLSPVNERVHYILELLYLKMK